VNAALPRKARSCRHDRRHADRNAPPAFRVRAVADGRCTAARGEQGADHERRDRRNTQGRQQAEELVSVVLEVLEREGDPSLGLGSREEDVDEEAPDVDVGREQQAAAQQREPARAEIECGTADPRAERRRAREHGQGERTPRHGSDRRVLLGEQRGRRHDGERREAREPARAGAGHRGGTRVDLQQREHREDRDQQLHERVVEDALGQGEEDRDRTEHRQERDRSRQPERETGVEDEQREALEDVVQQALVDPASLGAEQQRREHEGERRQRAVTAVGVEHLSFGEAVADRNRPAGELAVRPEHRRPAGDEREAQRDQDRDEREDLARSVRIEGARDAPPASRGCHECRLPGDSAPSLTRNARRGSRRYGAAGGVELGGAGLRTQMSM
jgi:hypothetical protein